MLVLLPPSEGKTAPARGRPVDLGALTFPELEPQRSAVLDALAALCAGPQDAALAALGLAPTQRAEIDRDARLREAPAAPAARVYSGVLYERLRLAELPAPARRRVLIVSALWGAVRPGDRIPAYRLSMGARLPGIPGLAAHWRPALAQAIADKGLVVDLRSGPYAAAWVPRSAAVLSVRGFTERPDGSRAVVSHMVKATRGDVARVLLSAPRPPRTAQAAAELVRAAGHRVELGQTRAGWALDVIQAGP